MLACKVNSDRKPQNGFAQLLVTAVEIELCDYTGSEPRARCLAARSYKIRTGSDSDQPKSQLMKMLQDGYTKLLES
jgi:hypothetical protein